MTAINVKYTFKPSNGLRGLFSLSIGPESENDLFSVYRSSGWMIWQDLTGAVKYQNIVSPSNQIENPVVVSLPEFQSKQLTSLSLSFDANNRAIYSWGEKSVTLIEFYDSENEKKQTSWEGVDCQLFFDGILSQSNLDVIAFYLDVSRTKIYCRLQKDEYATEYLYADLKPSLNEQNINQNKTHNSKYFILERVLITVHNLVLILTDSVGRLIRVESESYGFNTSDYAQNVIFPSLGEYREVKIYNSGLNDVVSNVIALGLGQFKQKILVKAFDDFTSLEYNVLGSFIQQTYVKDPILERLDVSLYLLNGSLENRVKTENLSDSFISQVSFKIGNYLKFNQSQYDENSYVSYQFRSGILKQLIYSFFYDDSSFLNVLVLNGSLTVQEIKKQTPEEEFSFVEYSLSNSFYYQKIFTYELSELTELSFNLTNSSYFLTILNYYYSENSFVSFNLYYGDYSDQPRLYVDDLASNMLTVNAGYYVSVVKSQLFLASLTHSIGLGKGFVKILYQQSDAVVENITQSYRINSGLLGLVDIKIKTIDEASQSAVTVFGGLYATQSAETNSDIPYFYFKAPSHGNYNEQASIYNDLDDLIIATFLEE